MGLEPTDLDVAAGEVVALIGPNGSGKTTFLRLLATDLRPSSGELVILGHDAGRPTPDLRRSIAYAPDRPVHFEALTGAENLRYFRALGRGRGEGESDHPTETLGLRESLDQPVSAYSFGMRRRLLLAATLAGPRPLLLLDEPALGLDPSGVNSLGALLRSAADHGSAVVLATNEVRDIPEWASRVVFLHRGTVIADGTPAELLARVGGRTNLILTVAGVPPEVSRGFSTMEGVRAAEAGEPRESPGSPAKGAWTARGRASDPGPGFDPRGVRSVRLESTRGASVLPEILRRILDAGGEIRDVLVREPDLRDAFRLITGEDLGVPRRIDLANDPSDSGHPDDPHGPKDPDHPRHPDHTNDPDRVGHAFRARHPGAGE